jgi:hypothetical protein
MRVEKSTWRFFDRSGYSLASTLQRFNASG